MTRPFKCSLRRWGSCLLLLGFLTGGGVLPVSAATQNFSAKKNREFSVIEPPLAAYQVGERFDYDVFWMGISVGSASLEVKEKIRYEGRDAYHLVARAQTNDFLSSIYPVRDEVHSVVSASDFYPLEFRKTLSEGRYRADERVRFDWEAKKATYESLLNGSRKEFALPRRAHDFLSAFYWFRLQPAAVGETLELVVNDEARNWDLRLQVLRRETKELRGRPPVDALVVEPKTRLKGVLYRRGRAWAYFGPDRRRTPLWITLRTPFGPIVGVLRPAPEGAPGTSI